jgi:hypothetical protein
MRAEKKVMVMSIIHPFDSVEVIGVFDDVTELQTAFKVVFEKSSELKANITNLHIYECPLNKIIAEFYPDDYDAPDSVGNFMENQKDICDEILGKEYLESIKENQKKHLC